MADCDIVVASNRETRERAYALAGRVYSRAGYVPENGPQLCISPFDAMAQTMTLLAGDGKGNDWATISVVFDSADGLPCDEIYKQEADSLRIQGRRLAEVTRLAINETCPTAKSVLLHLFNQAYIFTRLVRAHSDLLAEVNPRHVTYYQRIIRFEAGRSGTAVFSGSRSPRRVIALKSGRDRIDREGIGLHTRP